MIHAAVGAMKDIKRRADFEVYLKKFLQSLNIILPNAAAHPYRGSRAAVRLPAAHGQGAVQGRLAGHRRRRREGEGTDQRASNRAGDQSRRFRRSNCCRRDFLEHVQKHRGGDPEAKASEMEHAIRKHCTVHFDEDPAFYRRLSEKLEKLIEAVPGQLESAGRGLESTSPGGRGRTHRRRRGLTREATTFYDYIVQLAFNGGGVPAERSPRLKGLMLRVVEMLQDTIGIIDFWKKPIEVKKLRGNIDTEILLAKFRSSMPSTSGWRWRSSSWPRNVHAELKRGR